MKETKKNNFKRTICRTNKNAVTPAVELFRNEPTSFVNEAIGWLCRKHMFNRSVVKDTSLRGFGNDRER